MLFCDTYCLCLWAFKARHRYELFVGTLDSFSQKLLRELRAAKLNVLKLPMMLKPITDSWCTTWMDTVSASNCALYLAGELKSVDSFVKLVHWTLVRLILNFPKSLPLKACSAQTVGNRNWYQPFRNSLDGEHYKHVSGTVFRNLINYLASAYRSFCKFSPKYSGFWWIFGSTTGTRF